MEYELTYGELAVKVASYGGELVSVKKSDKERLWQNPTGEWAGHAPLLFPVCGHFGVKVDGVCYPIRAHGLAKRAEFDLVEKGDNFISLAFQSNDETRKEFPFDFIFTVTYRIVGDTLQVEYDVKNPATTPMYFACGCHEGYALDENVDGYQIVFETQEKLTHYPHNDDGYLTGETQDYGTMQTFPLPRDVMQGGLTLIFKDVVSRKVQLMKKDKTPLVELSFDGFSNLLLWRAGDAKYICIEPWTNVPDVADKEDIEFSQKEGVIKVNGGENKKMVHTITFF